MNTVLTIMIKLIKYMNNAKCVFSLRESKINSTMIPVPIVAENTRNGTTSI